MRKKIDITYDLVTTSPELQGLTKDSIKAVLSATYSDYLLTHHRSFRTQYDCVKDYVDGMSDCDEDFAITTLGTLVGAIGATIFGTPVAGAAAVSTGIGIAYAQHTRCASSVARDYRKCRGYQ